MRKQESPSMSFHSHKRLSRSLLCLLLVLSALVSFFFFYDLRAIPPHSIAIEEALPENVTLPDRDNDYPPNYRNLRKWIHDLPQHNLSLPFPEGKDGRYVKFSCQVQQLGWNNLLNEVCVALSFLTLESLFRVLIIT